MKNITILVNGYPITADDLVWLQEEFKEVTRDLLGLFANLGAGNRLICGGEVTTITPTNRTVTGGWVYWNGDLLKFNGTSLTGTGQVVLSRSTAVVPPTKMQFGTPIYPYTETIAQLGLTPAIGNPALLYLETTLRAGVSSWTSVALISPDWQAFIIPTLYHPPAYRRLNTGGVELRGHVEIGSTGALATAFVLPAPVRPKRAASFARSYVDGLGNMLPCWVEVQINGEVNILGVVAAVGNHLSLDGITYDARS